MTEETKAAATEDGKVEIKPDVSQYVDSRSASGSKTKHNGDPVATALAGATLEEVYDLTAEATEIEKAELQEKYKARNDGMQRMILGNRLRGIVNKMNKAEEDSGGRWIADLASGVQAEVEKRTAEAAEAKAKKAAEAKAKAVDEKAAKTPAKAKPKAKPKAKAA